MTPNRLLALVFAASLLVHGCGDRDEDSDDWDDGDDSRDSDGAAGGDGMDGGDGTDGSDGGDGTDGSDGSDGTDGADGTAPSDVDADGWTAAEGDCDDMTTVFPGAAEVCDGVIDHDCDGVVTALPERQRSALRFTAEAGSSTETLGDILGGARRATWTAMGATTSSWAPPTSRSLPRAPGRGGPTCGAVGVAGTRPAADGDTSSMDRSGYDFGWRLSIADDLDGDGFGDLLVASGELSFGAVFLCLAR